MDISLFKILVNSIPQPIWILDIHMNLIYKNDKFKSDILDDEKIEKVCRQAIESKEVKDYKKSDLYVIHIIPLIKNGIVEAVAGIQTFDEKKNTEYGKILNSIPAMVFYKDKDLKFMYANKNYTELFDITDDISGMDNSDFLKSVKMTEKFKKDDKKVIETKQEIVTEAEFTKKDGTSFSAQIIKAPVVDNNDEVEGIAGVFVDITAKKKFEDNLKRLSYTDVLTNVYNRTYFEKEAEELLKKNKFPIGVIMGDANGLKIVNDTLGHAEGDKLLVLITNVIKEVCGNKEKIFRIGGDEFAILIPNTTDYECELIIKKIFKRCKEYKHDLIDLSIALGASITYDSSKSIYDTLKEAEDKVYKQKIVQGKSINSSIISSLQATLQEKSLETKEHTSRVVKYSKIIGEKLSLPLSVMDELILVAKLHDIGKIGVDDSILLKKNNLTDEEFEIIKSHTEKGYRIIKAANHLESVAKGVLTHHERWDGTGYPMGMKGEEIPLIARIVNVADAYDIMTSNNIYRQQLTKNEAIEELKENSGKQFDPDIVKLFINYIINEQ